MDKKKGHIDKKFISREDIKKYREGTLSNAEQHRIEKIMLEEGLEGEAMEGISTIEAKQVEEDLNSLQDQLQKKHKQNRGFTIPVWHVAAAVLLLGLLSFSVYYLLEQQPNGELISLISEKTVNDEMKEKSTQTFEKAQDAVEKPSETEKGRPADEEKEVNSYEPKHEESAEAIEKQARVSGLKSISVEEIELEDDVIQPVTLDKDASQALITKTEIDIEKDAEPVIAMRNNAETADEVMAEKAQPMARMKKNEMMAVSGQEQEIAIGSKIVFIDYPVEKEKEMSYFILPTPMGGVTTFNKYIRENIQYPPEKIKTETMDTVAVIFTVAVTGEIKNLHIKNGQGSFFDQEAKRLILEGPKWQYAIKDGEPVEKKVRVRILFSPLD